jgi:hypothetical protein
MQLLLDFSAEAYFPTCFFRSSPPFFFRFLLGS